MAITSDTETTTARRSLARPQILSHEARPEAKGWTSWITTTDHKKIGIMYLYTVLAFFLLGGVEALLLRIQLGAPDNTFLSPEKYNQIFTMHGTTMIFLVVVPLWAGFANYLVPLMIGARDVAFPRINAWSYWMFLFGGIALYASVFFHAARGRLVLLRAALVQGVLALRRPGRVDLHGPPHRPVRRCSAPSTSSPRSTTCARPAWAGAASRCSCGRS